MTSEEFFSRSDAPWDQLAVDQRAQSLLFAIERRTAYIVTQSRRAIETLFLNPDTVVDFDPGFFKTLALKDENAIHLSVRDLERYAPHWQAMAPEDASLRAALCHLLAQKYALTFAAVPRIRAALGLDEEAVKNAYQALCGQPLETVFTAPGERDRQAVSTAEPEGETLADIEAGLEWIYLPRGETLFRQGEAGDSLYVLVNGRLRVVSQGQAGSEQVVDELTRGEIVGEMGVLTGEKRSATVYAIRDTELVRLPGAEFNRLVEKHPKAMMRITQILVARLRQMMLVTQRDVDALATIAVVPGHPDTPLADFAVRLAAALAAHGPTLHLNRDRLDHQHERGAAQTSVGEVDNNRVVAWLNEQEAKYRFVIYEAEAVSSPWTSRCIRQADRILIVSSAEAEPALGAIETEITRAKPGQTAARRDLVLLQPERHRPPVGTQKWLTRVPVERHHHVCLSAESDFKRLARLLTGRAVGLVLGGGAALGLAHIGIIRAIEEAGIPIDLVGGASAGSVIGAQYALGWDYPTMLQTNKRLFSNPPALLDFTLPFVSFIAGRRFSAALVEMFGDRRIEDLWTKYFCVSSDLTRAEVMLHQTGPLWRYVRASCSFPGILPPLPEEGRLLVDGGLLDNVPIDTMREMCEGGPVIAVNVSPPTWLKDYPFSDTVSAWELLRSRLGRTSSKRNRADILGILVRSALLGSVRSRLLQAERADLYINPPLERFGLFDGKFCEEIVSIGYQAARQKIEAWQNAPRGP